MLLQYVWPCFNSSCSSWFPLQRGILHQPSSLTTFLVAASMLTSSFATSVWQLFLSQGACFGYGMGFLYITASAIVPQWFSSRRSLAIGIASSGAGFGGLAYNLGAGAGLDNLGWRWTYRILACTTLAVNLCATLLLKDRNKVVRPSKKAFDIKEFVRLEDHHIGNYFGESFERNVVAQLDFLKKHL